jgi:hypothetical protein
MRTVPLSHLARLQTTGQFRIVHSFGVDNAVLHIATLPITLPPLPLNWGCYAHPGLPALLIVFCLASVLSIHRFYDSCTDECYLRCHEYTCSSSENCVVSREDDVVTCSCETKIGVIVGIALGSFFGYCVLVTIFVCLRRRAAMRKPRDLQVAFIPAANQYVVLPESHPHAVAAQPYYQPVQ